MSTTRGRDAAGDPQRAVLRALLRSSAAELLAYFEHRVRVGRDARLLLHVTVLQAWRQKDTVPLEVAHQRLWLLTVAASALARRRRPHRQRPPAAAAARRPRGSAAERTREVLELAHARRELIMLIHWDGSTVVEAAAVLDPAPTSAGGRYSAARRTLTASLSDHAWVPASHLGDTRLARAAH